VEKAVVCYEPHGRPGYRVHIGVHSSGYAQKDTGGTLPPLYRGLFPAATGYDIHLRFHNRWQTVVTYVGKRDRESLFYNFSAEEKNSIEDYKSARQRRYALGKIQALLRPLGGSPGPPPAAG
jgi:hypothetical protein